MRYESNLGEMEALVRGAPVQGLVREHGERLAAAAGDGFVASYMQGKSRFGGIVYADTWSAKHRDRRDNVLVRVLG
ncbi:hypothetical protein [Corynebacterium stationis]|uniref:hypothetical protein n=1 Tax=Corynebacterium stationis TaxID=1705 RepID=UPI0028AA687A|nr:hypothetical protein [Corynebacterium stationis]